MSIELNSVQEPCTGPELQVGEIFGVRAFWVDEHSRLLPVTFAGRSDNKPWRPGENVARCQPFSRDSYDAEKVHYAAGKKLNLVDGNGKIAQAPAPVPGCVCGFYGYFDRDATNEEMSLTAAGDGTGVYALGVVAAYGRCLVGSRGFRAEKARVVAVALDASRRFWRNEKSLVAALASNYDVSVYRTRGELIEKHPLTERPRTPDRDPRFWEEI